MMLWLVERAVRVVSRVGTRRRQTRRIRYLSEQRSSWLHRAEASAAGAAALAFAELRNVGSLTFLAAIVFGIAVSWLVCSLASKSVVKTLVAVGRTLRAWAAYVEKRIHSKRLKTFRNVVVGTALAGICAFAVSTMLDASQSQMSDALVPDSTAGFVPWFRELSDKQLIVALGGGLGSLFSGAILMALLLRKADFALDDDEVGVGSNQRASRVPSLL